MWVRLLLDLWSAIKSHLHFSGPGAAEIVFIRTQLTDSKLTKPMWRRQFCFQCFQTFPSHFINYYTLTFNLCGHIQLIYLQSLHLHQKYNTKVLHSFIKVDVNSATSTCRAQHFDKLNDTMTQFLVYTQLLMMSHIKTTAQDVPKGWSIINSRLSEIRQSEGQSQKNLLQASITYQFISLNVQSRPE